MDLALLDNYSLYPVLQVSKLSSRCNICRGPMLSVSAKPELVKWLTKSQDSTQFYKSQNSGHQTWGDLVCPVSGLVFSVWWSQPALCQISMHWGNDKAEETEEKALASCKTDSVIKTRHSWVGRLHLSLKNASLSTSEAEYFTSHFLLPKRLLKSLIF